MKFSSLQKVQQVLFLENWLNDGHSLPKGINELLPILYIFSQY
jgi:hypothetical protein